MLPYDHVGHVSECNHQQDLSLLKTILAYSRLLSPGRSLTYLKDLSLSFNPFQKRLVG